MKKFWNITNNELRLDGTIAEESWWGDEVTPKAFREELKTVKGDITVYINSPGGDVFAGSQIYTALKEHKGKVTVKIDGLAASAASVIAMAGDTVVMAPTAYMMIHNPLTCVFGNKEDLKKASKVLDEVKEGLLNAYEDKTGLAREKISALMDAETWMSARSALELGFCDEVLDEEPAKEPKEDEPGAGFKPPENRTRCVFAASTTLSHALLQRVADFCDTLKAQETDTPECLALREKMRKAADNIKR